MASKEKIKYYDIKNIKRVNKYNVISTGRGNLYSSVFFKEYIKLLVDSGVENIYIITKNGKLTAKEWLKNNESI